MSMGTKRKARKDHVCTFCGEPIPAGTMYQDINIRPWDHPDNDGYFKWRLHGECLDFWNDEYGDHGDFVWDEEVGEFKAALAHWKAKHSPHLSTVQGQQAGKEEHEGRRNRG